MTSLARIPALGLALLLGLAACGNETTRSPLGIAGQAVLSTVRPGETVDARDVLTPQMIAASQTSAILVVQRKTDTGFSMVPEAANLGTVDWRGAGGQGILQRDGIVVGTRGFGHDLLTADVAGLDAAFDAGGASDVRRVNRVLNGRGVIEVRDYLCDVRPVGSEVLTIYGTRHATRVFEEDCTIGGGDFTNRYWVESDGTVRKSIERISPEIGDLEVTRLTE